MLMCCCMSLGFVSNKMIDDMDRPGQGQLDATAN